MTGPKVLVRGAGVAGLVTAVSLADHGASITLYDRRERLGMQAASWQAGGMLAPWCEAEVSPQVIMHDSAGAIDWWENHVPDVMRQGSLVVAPPRDMAELARFSRRTDGFKRLYGPAIGALEPDLTDRFDRALFFEAEAHVDPRKALAALVKRLIREGHTVQFGHTPPTEERFDWVIDCTGIAAQARDDNLYQGLRGVRGEMVLLRCPEVTLHRPVRMLHPRIPVYIVPREDSVFMVGATMVESDDSRGVTVRSMTDLMNAAYTLHPAFAEAEILEANAGLRPAFADNIPRIRQDGRRIALNGMYRHGFLLSPARAQAVARTVFAAQ